MSEQHPSDVLGALPRRRPHRRSDKRPSPAPVDPTGTQSKPAARTATSRRRKPAAKPANPRARETAATPAPAPADAKPAPAPRTVTPRTASRGRPQRLRQPAQPAGVPPTSHDRPPSESGSHQLLGTAAQAAAELAEIGLSVGARALRRVVDRLPRP